MPDFRMNWYDYKNYQFVYDGIVHKICLPGRGGKVTATNHGLPRKHRILFLLNIHRGRFVSADDIIDFIYEDVDPDDWPEFQEVVLRTLICQIRKRLPKGVKIINWFGFGYKLQID